MGKPKRIYKKPPSPAEVNKVLREIGSKALYKTMSKGISKEGEKHCAEFISNLETTFLAFREYHKELCKIEISKQTVLDNLHPEEKEALTEGQKNAVYSTVKQITKEIDTKHHQTLRIFERWLRELDRYPENLQDYIFDLAAK